MPLNADFTHVFAVPNAHSIIDAVNPATGCSYINGHSLAEIRARYPMAECIAWSDWQKRRIREQDTPIEWTTTTCEQYHDMLNVLPPAAWIAGGFLVGEPTDHHCGTGRPRYQAYRHVGTSYLVASRPITLAEFRAVMQDKGNQ